MSTRPRLLITGANGQVGHALSHRIPTRLRERLDAVRACTRADINLEHIDTLRDAMRDFKPDIVINAAAYTAVDKAEDEPDVAEQVNGQAVGILAELCRARGALLVHYSTDYVFDGQQTRPYLETDPVNPQNAYGRSKASGERFIQEVGGDAVVLRTSWVFARHGDNFYQKMLRLAAQRDTLSVVDDQAGAPTPADWLADVALHWAERRANGAAWPNGIFHAASRGQTTWHDYAALTFELTTGTHLLPRKPQLNRARSADMQFKASRPAWSVLDTTKLQETTGLTPPDWQAAVTAALLADLAEPAKPAGTAPVRN